MAGIGIQLANWQNWNCVPFLLDGPARAAPQTGTGEKRMSKTSIGIAVAGEKPCRVV
jgi:hypothetical protein